MLNILGSYVAIVTPFNNGEVDEDRYRELLRFHIKEGTNGIVPCGTTGESATLSPPEHKRIIDITVEEAKGRVQVIAGTGSNNTREAIELTRYAKEKGADAALLITPYYNKPSQEGLYLHYKEVAKQVDIPIILYNVPGRTAVNMLPATIARLAEIDNIIGIKEASGSIEQVSDIVKLCGDRFSVISGDDANTFPIMTLGGRGVISVTANIVPREVRDMCALVLKGDIKAARDIHYRILDLHRAMFFETNPVPVKTALSLMGKISGELRLPLSPMGKENLERLKDVMKMYHLM